MNRRTQQTALANVDRFDATPSSSWGESTQVTWVDASGAIIRLMGTTRRMPQVRARLTRSIETTPTHTATRT